VDRSQTPRRCRARAAVLLAALVGPLALVLGLRAAPLQDEGETPAAAERKLPEGYVGTETCAACHEEQHALLSDSLHATLLGNPGSVGCESCHGPGAAHAEEFDDPALIRHPRKLARVASEKLCMTCHGEETWVPAWLASDWRRDGISCVDCHTVHQHRAAITDDRPPFPTKRDGSPVAAALPPAPRMTARGPHGVLPARAAPKPPAAPPAAATPAVEKDAPGEIAPTTGIVRSAACRACHTRACSTFEDSPHVSLLGREAEKPACESCHGPGWNHVQSGGVRKQMLDPETAPPAVAEAVCLSCHRENSHVGPGWATSEHARNGVSCLACHGAVGHPELPPAETRTSHPTQLATCGRCHPDVAAEFRFPNHHRVPEGAMDCTDCHNPHKTGPKINDLELKFDACVTCHAEKKGPFAYEHNADRVEGCVVCHLPHGSINRRLLTHREVRMQCLQCHSNILPFHDQSPGSQYRNCLNCHTEIHGSHLDPWYFR